MSSLNRRDVRRQLLSAPLSLVDANADRLTNYIAFIKRSAAADRKAAALMRRRPEHDLSEKAAYSTSKPTRPPTILD